MSALGHVWTASWQELSNVAAALVGCGHVSGLFVRRLSRWPYPSSVQNVTAETNNLASYYDFDFHTAAARNLQRHFAFGKCDPRARPSQSRQSIDVPEKAYAEAQRNLHRVLADAGLHHQGRS